MPQGAVAGQIPIALVIQDPEAECLRGRDLASPHQQDHEARIGEPLAAGYGLAAPRFHSWDSQPCLQGLHKRDQVAFLLRGQLEPQDQIKELNGVLER